MTPHQRPATRYRDGMSQASTSDGQAYVDAVIYICMHTSPRYRVYIWNGTSWDAWAMSARPHSPRGRMDFLGHYGTLPGPKGMQRIGLKQLPWPVQVAIRDLRGP